MPITKIIKTIQYSEDRLKTYHTGFESSFDPGTILIDDQTTYQEIEGFGGAFTEAGGYVLSQLSQSKQDEIINAYFDVKNGHGYNLCRTHINSCDFSLGNYASCEEAGDVELNSFNIKRDHEYLIPFIKSAQQLSKDIKILASPWSPPAWMKTNGEMNNGGQLKKEYSQVWANYYVKYIEAYEKEAIDIWGVTIQNEPAATQVWDSCIYSAEEERDFIKRYLGPTFTNHQMTDKKIIIWDHNRDVLLERVHPILSDKEASQYVWGVGLHWYMCEDFENSSKVKEQFPETNILFTEGCNEGGVQLNTWYTGERYGRNIIGDLNNWLVGWIDWNMILDHHGGPNHVGNFCDAPIIVNTETHDVIYQSSYFYLGHFSRYIKPGAVRIGHINKHDAVQTVSFKNPNQEIVTVLMNETDIDEIVTLNYDDEAYKIDLKAHSIYTVIFTEGI